MVATKLTIKRTTDSDKFDFVFNSFFEKYNIDLLEVSLSGASECGQYDIIYTFFSKEMVDHLTELMIEADITIFKREDFTNQIIKLIIDNDLESFKNKLDYVVEFDNIIDIVSEEEIIVDTILDKILNEGENSLTEREQFILKKNA